MSNPTDIRISWDTDLMEGDFGFENNDLEHDDGLETAAIVSLFTDAKANADDILPDPNRGNRGWWGDLVSGIEYDRIGSKLWLLERNKTTEETLVRAKQYILESLQWMIDDNITKKIEVEVERAGTVVQPTLAFLVKIYKDTTTLNISFNQQWEAQENAL